jgi:hypothetical protein
MQRSEPYRSAWIPEAARERAPLGEFFLLCAVLWVGSVARVVLGVLRHEPFDAELSLATLTVMALPWTALMKS